jgi:Glycosyl hydrolase family 99
LRARAWWRSSITLVRDAGEVVAIHLEPYPDRSPATVAADLAYIPTLGIRDVYVYHPRDLDAAVWASLRQHVPATIRLFAGTARPGFAAAGRFDGIYTYDFVTYRGGSFARLCTEAHAAHLLCEPSVGPGYDGLRAGEQSPTRARRNGATYDALWAAAIRARPDAVTITSFNEWGEGTQIEPARPRRGYRGYDGAWGLTGPAAQTAYLDRTAYWAARYRGLR